jgi:hypothetical protein
VWNWSLIKKSSVEFGTLLSQWEARAGALINIKQENLDKIEADNGIKRSGVRIYRNKYNFQKFKADF